MLNAALGYAKLGWRVFPILAVGRDGGCECEEGIDCSKPGKHPAIKDWVKAASDDKEQIEAWWSERPDRGIGIATGEESGLTVLDVDGDEGVEELGKLSVGVGMPPTPCASSRPGRFHYYFGYNSAIKSKSKNLGTRLDSRSDNGYVVAPPSRHATGSTYTWVVPPTKVEPAVWPEFLKDEASKKAAKLRGRPPKEIFDPHNPRDVEKLLDALSYIDADDEEKWGQIGWIMGRSFRQSDEGFAHYSAWASKSRKYDKKKSRAHYYETSKALRGGDLRTTGSIFKWAEEAGWVHQDLSSAEPRALHVYENPFREETMVQQFAVAASAAPRIFAMGTRLVHIVLYAKAETRDLDIDRDAASHVVWDHTPDTLAVELSEVAAYYSYREKGHIRTGFSRPSVNTFVSCHRYEGIKPLVAFVAHPTIRQDGSLITEVGYDTVSGLFLTGKVEGLVIKDSLTSKTGKEAMKRLMAPFSEYPWASGKDRSVFAAALFTVGLRHLFDVCPLFAFSSPKYGSGKTQLAECISRLWYGTTLSKATWTPNPEEMEKRIAAFLLAGDRIVCLDNVTEGQRLEDSTLNKVLTSRRNTFRILGKTERVELTNEATWFATGNQINMSGDIARRALVCYIDAKVVDPSARSFTIANLQGHVLEHRAALMSDALSIVSSWIRAGRPSGSKAHREYGSFGSWYEMIRGILLWVGEADVAHAIDSVTEEDTEGMALDHFANSFRKALPPDGSRVTLSTIMKLFGKENDLASAFKGCIGGRDNSDVNHRSLSDIMRRCENKIFVSDNPGHLFTIIKRRDTTNNQWVWGYEFADSKEG